MTAFLAGQFSARRYRRGRVAAMLCVAYLALVVAAAGYTLYDSVFVETIGASFAGVPLILLTAPSSILSVALFDVVQSPGPPWVSGALNVVVMVTLGAFQALLGWWVLRGATTGTPE